MDSDTSPGEGEGRESAWQHIQAGDRLLAAGDEPAAEAAYRRAVEADASLGDAHHRLAVALYKRGAFDQAAECATEATRRAPDTVEAWFTLGLILWDARDPDASVQAFERVIELQPSRAEAHHYRGRVLYESGRPHEAIPSFERAAELQPDSSHIAHDLAITEVACENWREAERWFARCIELEPGNAETYYELGQAHERDVTTPDADAEMAYRRAVELNPEHLPAHFRLAVLWAKRRRIDHEARGAALGSLRELAARQDLVSLFPDAHLVHYLQGAILDDDPATHREAAAAYTRCVEIDPAFAPAHNNLGILARAARDPEAAAVHFRNAIIADPGYDSALHNLCRVWYDQPNELAIRQIRELMDIMPDEAPGVIGRIMGHLVDAAKSDAYASTYDKAHEIKNTIGILGARMRKALASEGCAEVVDAPELLDLQTRAFDAIRGYLSAIQTTSPEMETVDCAHVLRRTLRQLVVTKPDGVEVHREIEKGLPPVTGNERRLTQLFRNLTVNAFEAMSNGGTLHVVAESFGRGSTRPGETVQRGIRICFEDSGEGMDEEGLRRAFDPGYTTKPSGSGYGLAVVGQVVREHGGTITLEAGSNGGTRATIELPERPQPEAAADRLRLRPVIFEDWRRLVQAELDAIKPGDGSRTREAGQEGARER